MFKIGPKNAEIAVLEQLAPKLFFTTQPWWEAFKETVDYKNVRLTKFSLFSPLKLFQKYCLCKPVSSKKVSLGFILP